MNQVMYVWRIIYWLAVALYVMALMTAATCVIICVLVLIREIVRRLK